MMMALSFFLNNLAKNFNLRVVLIKIPSLLPATLTNNTLLEPPVTARVTILALFICYCLFSHP